MPEVQIRVEAAREATACGVSKLQESKVGSEEMSNTLITQPPSVGLPVKLKHGMLQLSARQIQHVTATKKLEIGKDNISTLSELTEEGGYWIKTDYTKGEWWAWSLFRIA